MSPSTCCKHPPNIISSILITKKSHSSSSFYKHTQKTLFLSLKKSKHTLQRTFLQQLGRKQCWALEVANMIMRLNVKPHRHNSKVGVIVPSALSGGRRVVSFYMIVKVLVLMLKILRFYNIIKQKQSQFAKNLCEIGF